MTRWTWRVFCPGCFKGDPAGCFDGSYEYAEETWKSVNDAIRAMQEEEESADCDIWVYEVVEAVEPP